MQNELMNTASGAQAPIYVTIPAGLEDLVPGYLVDRRRDLVRFREWVESKDFDKIRVLAHNMKGSGSSFGFAPLTKLGAKLEAAARGADLELVTRHISDLSDYLERVRLKP